MPLDKSNPFNLAQVNLDIFHKKDPGRVLWQPRIDFWYDVNKKRGTLPDHLKACSLLDVYDYVHGSIRYFVNPLCHQFTDVQVNEEWLDENSLRRIYESPAGVLSEVVRFDAYHLSSYNTEYRLKTPSDFEIFEHMLQNEMWSWDQQAYELGIQRAGGRGAPQFFYRRSPLQGLFIENMGFENTIFMLSDHPEVIEQYLEIASAADDAMYRVLCAAPIPILNFGENIDTHMDPPPIWRKYLLPYYQKRVNQLAASGKVCHIHIDGSMKPLIRLIRESPFPAIEACTPLPQGDVTLEEIKDALGDRILLDGIPALYFLPSWPIEDLKECTQRIVDLFYPNLILGISDEPPPDSDIERVRMVGEWVQEMSV